MDLPHYPTTNDFTAATLAPCRLAVTVAVAGPRHFVSGVQVHVWLPDPSAYDVPRRLWLTARYPLQ